MRPCGGTVDFYDRFTPFVSDYWTSGTDQELPRFTLDLRSQKSEILGRADVSRAHAWGTTNQSVLHELVHLVVGRHDGIAAPVLTEGVAEALGPSSRVNLLGPPGWPVTEFAFSPLGEFDAGYYPPAAQLVAFLIRRYGLPTVRSAYQSIERNATAEEIEAGFVEAFGDGIYDAFDEFEATDQCPLFAWECGGEVLPVVQLPLIVGRDQTCDHPSTLGAIAEGDDNWYPYHMMTLDVGDAPVLVTFDVSDNANLRIEDCVSTCDELTPTSNLRFPAPNSPHVTDWELPPGRHLVTVRARDPSQPFSASIVRAEP